MDNTPQEAVAEVAPNPEAERWRALDKRRDRYYTLLVLVIIVNVGYMVARVFESPLQFLALGLDLVAMATFLVSFLGTASRCGMPTPTVVLIGIGTLLPIGLIPLIVILVADNHIGKCIGQGWKAADPEGFAAAVKGTKGRGAAGR
jgi:hypothetical protein